MPFDPALHHRRSIRQGGHDYADPGAYFVTLCTAGRRPLFGTVVNGRMALNDAGRAAAACWRDIPDHFPNVSLDEWVVMPDHVHGLIHIVERSVVVGANDHSPQRPCGTSRTLGSIVRGFKIGVTRRLGGESPWQRNYYDIVVRDATALANICAYIRDNPAHWDVLRYGEPRFTIGNRNLLNLRKTAFLASRRADGANDDSPLRMSPRPACVVSGFLSPMERAVFDACLGNGTPMIWMLPRGLPSAWPPRVQRAIEAGRLLILTPFDAAVTGASGPRAAWCNQYVLEIADEIVIGQLAPDGMLACLLADLRKDKPIQLPRTSDSELRSWAFDVSVRRPTCGKTRRGLLPPRLQRGHR